MNHKFILNIIVVQLLMNLWPYGYNYNYTTKGARLMQIKLTFLYTYEYVSIAILSRLQNMQKCIHIIINIWR